MPLSLWGGAALPALTGAGDDSTSYKILSNSTVRSLRGTGAATVSLSGNVLSVDVGQPGSLTASGDDSTSYKVLDGSKVRALRAAGGTNISLDQPNGILIINTPAQISGAGDGSTNGQNMLNGSQIKALKGGDWIQVATQGGDSIVISGNSSLTTALNGKQPTITVNGGDVSTGWQLLNNGTLLSVNDSTTITVKKGTSASGQDYLYWSLIPLSYTQIVGLPDQLTLLAPKANATFTGTTTVDTLAATSITIGGVSVLTSTQASNLYAVKTSPSFSGTVSASVINVNTLTVNTAATFSGTVTGLSSASVGLGNVDNTSDLNKPISTLVSTALAGKQASLAVLGDDTSSYKLINGTNVKGLIASGYISLSQTASAVTVGTTTALDTALASFLTQTAASSTYQTISGAASFLNAVSNITTDALQNIKLTTSGRTIALDYSNLLTTLSNYLTTSTASSTYLTTATASSTYLTQTAASSTYATSLSVSSTYAPKASPTFTGVLTAANIYASAASNNGMVQLAPLTDGTESSIGFFRRNGKATTAAGDVWIMGQAAHGTAAGTFALGCYSTGAIMTIQPTGATVFNYGVSATSLTVGGSSVLTTASAIPIASVTSLQSSLDAKANLSGAAFSGQVTVPSPHAIIPAAAGGLSEQTFHKYTDKSGITESGSQWTMGRGSHSVSANSFALGCNVLGAALTVDTTGVVAHPYGLTSGGYPVATKPWVSFRYISGTITNYGSVNVTGVTVVSAGVYDCTIQTAHPLNNAYGVIATCRNSGGAANFVYSNLTATNIRIGTYALSTGAATAYDFCCMTLP